MRLTAFLSPEDSTSPRAARGRFIRSALAALTSVGLVAAGFFIAPVAASASTPIGGNHAEILVKTGGERTGTGNTDIAGLDGVHLELWSGNSNGPSNKVNDGAGTWADCYSVAGVCEFEIPNDSIGSGNVQFWIVQAAPLAGSAAALHYAANDELVTGMNSGSFQTTDYRFRTGDINDSTRYTSGVDFMQTTANVRDGSSGYWQNSYNNPAAQAKCGLNIALLSDLSSSVDVSNALDDLKDAATGFVNALVGTPSNVSLYTFGTNAPATGANNATMLDKSTLDDDDVDDLVDRIDDYSIPGSSYTNWDAGLWQLQGKGYDQVIVITDGNPTAFNVGTTTDGVDTRFNEIERAIFSANKLKAQGTRIVTVGVGDTFEGGENLMAISGPVENSDYFTGDWETLSETLADIAYANCQGSVTVVKKVIPAGGTVADAQPAGDWVFDASASGVAEVSPVQGTTAADNGAVNFQLDDVPAQGTIFTAVEQQQPGYTIEKQGGKNAVCTKNGQTPVTVGAGTDPNGFTLTVGAFDIVNCTVYNRAPQPQVGLQVDKVWVVNNVTSPVNDFPDGFGATATLGGDARSWDTSYSFTATSTVVVDETGVTVPSPYCSVTSQKVTSFDGTPVTTNNNLATGTYTTPALVAQQGDHVVTVTNVVECDGSLTLLKTVAGGPADAAAWTLTADKQGGGQVISGSSGASAAVDPGTYVVAESAGGPDGYTLSSIECGPTAQGPWTAAAGGVVDVAAQADVFCLFTNTAIVPELKLKKVVKDDIVPADNWTLTATDGDQVVSGDGETDYEDVKAGVAYTLSETTDLEGGDEFTGQWICTVTGGPGASTVLVLGGTAEAPTVTLSLGQQVECVVTNTIQPMDPSIKKVATGSTPNSDGTWDISYDVTVTNPSAVLALEYYLADTPVLPTGVEGKSASFTVDAVITPVAWTSGPIQLTPSIATIAADGDPVTYTVVLTVAVDPTAVESTDACGEDVDGFGIDNTATLTVGLDTYDSSDCAVIDPPEVDYTKVVTKTTQNPNGSWTIVYEVEVEATGTGVALYDLRDVPEFGDGIDIDTASATADPAGNAAQQFLVSGWNGGFGDPASDALAHDRAITGGDVQTYEITITALVDADVVGTDAADCTIDQGETGTGFLNLVYLTSGGPERAPKDACSSPTAPEFVKDIVGGPVSNGGGKFTLTYTLTATNPSDVDLYYNLDDTIGFAPYVTVNSQSVTAPAGITALADWDGRTKTRIVEGELLAAGDEHVYTVTVVATPTILVEKNTLDCVPATPGHGYFNGAVLTSGADVYPDDACAPIPESDLPTLPLPPDDPELPTLAFTGQTVGIGAAGLGALLLMVGAAFLLLRKRRSPKH